MMIVTGPVVEPGNKVLREGHSIEVTDLRYDGKLWGRMFQAAKKQGQSA